MRSSAPERVASAVPLSPDIYLPGGRCFILSCRIQEKGYYCKHDNLEYVKYLLNDKVEYVHHKTKDIQSTRYYRANSLSDKLNGLRQGRKIY